MFVLAVTLLAVSFACAALVLLSVFVPGAPAVDAVFVTGTCAALVTSGALFWYMQRER